MLKTYKTEIKPTQEQIEKITKTIGVCRFVYNLYIDTEKDYYNKTKEFLSGYDFSKWLNNNYLKDNPDKSWLKEVSSKSVKQSIMNCDSAFRKFFKGQSKYPKFKSKKNNDCKMYFVKTDSKTIIRCDRHRIKVPTLGWVRLKEKGYIPTNPETHIIKSGTISYQAGRYYISVTVDCPNTRDKPILNDSGIGIDLGLKDFAITSDGKVFKNINKTSKVRKLEKKLKREQRKLSKKYLHKQNNRKGVATQPEGISNKNIDKQKLLVQKLHQRLSNIRYDYLNKCVNDLVRTKPSYITIEDLNVSGMMKNRHLSKAIKDQNFYAFRSRLTNKCKEYGIELRVADRFYPSSKTCHNCGTKNPNLKLSARVFSCSCGYVEDRDYNASLNLRDCVTYKVA